MIQLPGCTRIEPAGRILNLAEVEVYSFPPPSPPPPPPPPMLCSDECLAHLFGNGGPYANNLHCQDGAVGDDKVTGSTCAFGTDCTDCGPRYNMPPSPPPPPPPSPPLPPPLSPPSAPPPPSSLHSTPLAATP